MGSPVMLGRVSGGAERVICMFSRAPGGTEPRDLFAVGGGRSRPKGALASSNNKRKHMLPLSGTVGSGRGGSLEDVRGHMVCLEGDLG